MLYMGMARRFIYLIFARRKAVEISRRGPGAMERGLDADTWLKIANQLGVPGAILVFLAWFLTFRFWPWYTKVSYPNRVAQQNQLTALMSTASNTLIEMEAALLTIDRRLENVEDLSYSIIQNVRELRTDADQGLKDLGTLAAQAGKERRRKRVADTRAAKSASKPKAATTRAQQKTPLEGAAA